MASPRRTDNELIVTFGHELQHALEVADAPQVVSLASFAAFCAQRGKPNKPGHFETQAAQQVAKRIRTELSHSGERAGADGFIVGNLPKQSVGSMSAPNTEPSNDSWIAGAPSAPG